MDSLSNITKQEGSAVVNLSWEEVDEYVYKIISQLSIDKYKNIYAIPRGGLILGVILSHAFDIPMIYDENQITEKTLVVDDIIDSGGTMQKLLYKTNAKDCVALIEKQGSCIEATICGKAMGGNEWIHFPWEGEI